MSICPKCQREMDSCTQKNEAGQFETKYTCTNPDCPTNGGEQPNSNQNNSNSYT
jgi:hypothetical protein